MGKRSTSRRYDLRTFAAVKPWRVGRELAVQDLPGTKIQLFFETAIANQKEMIKFAGYNTRLWKNRKKKR